MTPLIENLEAIQDPEEQIIFLIDFVLDGLETRSDWLHFLFMIYFQNGMAYINNNYSQKLFSLATRARMRADHEAIHNTLKNRGFAAKHDYARANPQTWLI